METTSIDILHGFQMRKKKKKLMELSIIFILI